MPRSFIAIRFGSAFKDALVNTQNSLKSRGVLGSYCPLNNLHMTLAFIGEHYDLDSVRQAVSEMDFEPFTLSLGNLGSFPTRSGVIWCGVREHAPVSALATQLRQRLSSHGVSFSKTEFYPHISLVQHPSSIVTEVEVPPATTFVDKVVIMKSERIDGDLVYSEMLQVQQVQF